MHCTRKVTEQIYWIGGNDRRLALFENIFPIARGVSYNAYIVMDEKTVLLDTADSAISRQFMENVTYVLEGRELDYIIVNHMEPDHCALIEELIGRYPNLKLIGNTKTFQMMKQFFDFDVDARAVIVKEGDTFSSGNHVFHFVMAPMVHWPETMVTYEEKTKVLFSADGFGTFGALNGNLFADEIDFDRDWLADARRYYTNIVGKYGVQVQNLLKKAAALDIAMICPLHGPVWRENLGYILDKYNIWSTYQPEDSAVMIAYASMYGNTENAANVLAGILAEKGIRKIAVYDVSNTDVSELISETFRCSHIVLAAPTYNAGIYPKMENFLTDMKALNVQNRKVALLENGTWAATSGKQMRELVMSMKNMDIITEEITVKSTLKEEQYGAVVALADQLIATM